MREFVSKLPRVIGLIILLFLVSLNYKQVKEVSGDRTKEATVPTEVVKKYFPGYDRLEQQSKVAYVVGCGEKEVGHLIVTSPLADDVMGFGGPVPLVIAVSEEGRIMGLELLENDESPDFQEDIRVAGFFDSWNGKSLQEAVALEVDGVSGASMTTGAVTEGVRRVLSFYLNTEVNAGSVVWLSVLKQVLGWGVVVAAVVFMFMGGRLRRFRMVLLVASVLILGFWSGYFVSLALLYGWLVNGISIGGRVLLVVMTGLAFVFPLFFGKSYYCGYVCPYGAAQELAGKLRRRKFPLSGWGRFVVRYLRWVYFGVITGALLYGAVVDLSLFEPFAAFMFGSVGYWVISLAIVFLFLSVFFSRPWCNYFCPTGHLLEFLRRKSNGEGKKRIIGEWLCVLILVTILLFIVL